MNDFDPFFVVSDSVQCLDEFGVWNEVSIEEICKCSVTVTFPRWSKEFDRTIEDRGELIVKSSLPPRERKRRYCDSLMVEWTFVPNDQTGK